MAVKYKQKCNVCRKKYVIVTRRGYAICYDCEKKQLQGEIKDPKMKKMFDIPEEFYRENDFLRAIKRNYLRFENLTEKQIEAFKKTVKEMKQGER